MTKPFPVAIGKGFWFRPRAVARPSPVQKERDENAPKSVD